jgi:leucyl aminopeptidase (aminopeptidase T)
MRIRGLPPGIRGIRISSTICLQGAEPDDHVNHESDIHVDFMIGTADTTITAILNDGTEQVIFRNGVWTF